MAETARRRHAWVAAALLAGCAVPVPFARQLLFNTERPQLAVASDCARCHGEVVREWERSPHASAWMSPAFVRATADRSAPACLPCHAPAPLGEAGEIALRSDHLEEGVTCVSCHLSTRHPAEQLVMRGPHERSGPVDVHPIIVDSLFLEPDLCGTCHAHVFEEWRETAASQDEEPRICQDCHMPAIRRKIESYDPEHAYSAIIVALAAEIDGRRHLFAVPTDSDEDVRIELDRVSPGRVRVRVHNGLPHGIPSGGFGAREARVRVTWPDGESVERLRLRLGERIAAGDTLELAVEGVPDAVPVEVELERRASDGDFETVSRAAIGDSE